MMNGKTIRRRGSPLAMLGALVLVWIGARATMWENPFAPLPDALPSLLADKSPAKRQPLALPAPMTPQTIEVSRNSAGGIGNQLAFVRFSALGTAHIRFGNDRGPFRSTPADRSTLTPYLAAGHQLLLARAYSLTSTSVGFEMGATGNRESTPPFALPVGTPSAKTSLDRWSLDRWSLDAWAFWRQGSGTPAIAQGRAPIYGASQAGATLNFRLAPSLRQDPRLYARAYRALVAEGESELAAGVSARPFAAIPLRAHAEVRITDNAFGAEVRPAAFVTTEFPPQSLPLGIVTEVYAQGGYVGGKTPTAFADGQITTMREVREFKLNDRQRAKLSVGAGTWGGLQEDAKRLDVGPSMRLDVTIGKVPARLSVDWREQVAGDASPGSGVAATLSTRF